MIRATSDDLTAIKAFLTQRVHLAMFSLSNLARYGMDGTHERSMRFWIKTDGAEVTDVLGASNGGMVMPLLPTGDFAAAAEALDDTPVIGIIGPACDARGIEACGFAEAPRNLDADEPQFLLDLDELAVPDGPGALRPLSDAPVETIKSWIKDYDLNTLNADPKGIDAQVEKSYTSQIEGGNHVVLMDDERPLTKTGFNARLPEIVQIGGVYTPPELRSQGLARRAVALHLAQAKQQGVTRATLFAASEAACRAYRAIGFRQIGTWTLLLFNGPQRRRL